MNPFQKLTAQRIAAVCLVLAAVVSPVTWFIERERAEDAVVSFAVEEAGRLLRRFDALRLDQEDAGAKATAAAELIAGGLFDIVEIYDSRGQRLAEVLTPEGEAIERALPKHGAPRYVEASYESVTLSDGRWALRVFVPLRSNANDTGGSIAGYLEGVRVVPAWQHRQILLSAGVMAALAGLASLLCGLAVFPVVVRLARDNELHQQQVLAAQTALIDGLRSSERALEEKVTLRTHELDQSRQRTRELLHNILPEEIADELEATGRATPARHDLVTILFTDFSGFTQAVAAMPAARMVAELNEIFEAFDAITDRCGVEKIKTIGDAYMAAAGLPRSCPDHAQRCVRAGLQMIDYLDQRNRQATFKWLLRVGVHSGPVVAGVVGTRKYAFDIWGDTVNIAARMESSGAVGKVNVSAYTCDLIRNDFACEYRGKVEAKGKGVLDMYFVTGVITDETASKEESH